MSIINGYDSDEEFSFFPCMPIVLLKLTLLGDDDWEVTDPLLIVNYESMD
mgnify:CR=1 FL=1